MFSIKQLATMVRRYGQEQTRIDIYIYFLNSQTTSNPCLGLRSFLLMHINRGVVK